MTCTSPLPSRRAAGRPPQHQIAERRTRLLQVAGDLFLQGGYHRVSLQRIASHAGVAVRTIYTTFGGKADRHKNLVRCVRRPTLALLSQNLQSPAYQTMIEFDLTDRRSQRYRADCRSKKLHYSKLAKNRFLAGCWQLYRVRLDPWPQQTST